MQINLKNFFDYKPVFSEKEIEDFFEKEVKQLVIEYLWKEEWEMLQKAYNYAKNAHGSEKRLSGEPYIVHPVYVAKYLLLIKPNIFALQAALLHDVIEDTDITWDEILEEFWPEVAFLCLGLEKVGRVKYQGEDRQIETLKKTFLSMGQDIRVIFVKLADRIHNIQTLKYHPKREKQVRIAEETLKIYVPISKRLWIEVFQLYLENGSFAILEPDEFNRIFTYLEKNYSKVNIDKIRSNIEKILKKNEIEYLSIKWRLKSPYRIYLKFFKYKTTCIKEIKDILAFRIIVKNIATCYTTLWAIHAQYTPIIKRIKDYISIPKPNGYQSLHTTILWLYKKPVEIQIRTKKMDDLAEYWVAAHFIYKELWESKKIELKQIEWVNKLKEISKEYQERSSENKNFFNILDVDFLSRSVFVYTPAWKVIELPKWSTVLDFAFRVHTDIWLHFKSATVDGKIVPIDYKLRNWDIVEIKTFRNNVSVKKSWLNYVFSPTSKNKIRQYFNHLERQYSIDIWKDLLNKELKKYSLPELNSNDNLIKLKNSDQEIERYLIQISNWNLSISKFIRWFYPGIYNHKQEIQEKLEDVQKEVKSQVIIDNSKLFKYTFCPECKPIKWDIIIWKVVDEWIKIHKTSCKALKTINFQKLVEAHWDWQSQNWYEVVFKFNITDKKENIINIVNVLNEFNIKLLSINTINKNWKDYLIVDTNFKLPTTLHLIEKKLKKQVNNLFNSVRINFK